MNGIQLAEHMLEYKELQIWDSGDKFADRYTVVIGDDIYGIGKCFNQFCGNISQRDVNTGKLKFNEKNFGKKINYIPQEIFADIIQRIMDGEYYPEVMEIKN